MSPAISRALALLVAVLVALGGQVALSSSASAKLWKVPKPDLSINALTHLTEYETRVVHLINKKRTARDLEPVRYFSSCLDRLSERWARHLADTGELVHRSQKKVLRRCDLTWAGENLVRGTALTPAEAVKAWMGSPGHRAVLLKGRANRAGMGAKLDSQGRIVGVLNFGDFN